MNKIALIVLCAHALLIQNAFGQCFQSFNQGVPGYGPVTQVVSSDCGCGVNNVVSGVGNLVSVGNGGYGGFGGFGNGQLGVVGQLPIAGNTLVEGNLPVVGVVEFSGALPAGGYVSAVGITPGCECGNFGFGFY